MKPLTCPRPRPYGNFRYCWLCRERRTKRLANLRSIKWRKKKEKV